MLDGVWCMGGSFVVVVVVVGIRLCVVWDGGGAVLFHRIHPMFLALPPTSLKNEI